VDPIVTVHAAATGEVRKVRHHEGQPPHVPDWHETQRDVRSIDDDTPFEAQASARHKGAEQLRWHDLQLH